MPPSPRSSEFDGPSISWFHILSIEPTGRRKLCRKTAIGLEVLYFQVFSLIILELTGRLLPADLNYIVKDA